MKHEIETAPRRRGFVCISRMRLSTLGMQYSARAQSRATGTSYVRPARLPRSIAIDRTSSSTMNELRETRTRRRVRPNVHSIRPLANWPIRVHQAYLERGTYSSSICRKWKTDKVRRYLLLFALYLSNGNVYYFCLQKLKCKTWGGRGRGVSL